MLTLQNITLAPGGHPLLQDVSLSLDGRRKQRIALVGPNGAGKSSLFRVMTGQEAPYYGTVVSTGETVTVVWQDHAFTHPTAREHLMALLEEEWMAYQIDIHRDALGLTDALLDAPVSTLSGGEKLRVALAAALLPEPTILLLDEPTNHLDAAGIAWLEGFLEDFAGSIVLISHNRHFLDATCSGVWDIDATSRSIRAYTGRYSEYRVEKQRLIEQELHELEKEEKEIAALQLWLREHEFHPKYQFSSRVMTKKKRLARLQEAKRERPVVKQSPDLTVPSPSRKTGRLVHLVVEEKRQGSYVMRDKSAGIYAGKRMRLTGPNGAGKTTMLRMLAGLDQDFTGFREVEEGVQVAVLHQHSLLPEKMRLGDYLDTLQRHISYHSRGLLVRIGLGREAIAKKIGDLSMGQRRIVELAEILSGAPDILFLDEPTNHMDIESCEALEDLLQDYRGAVVYISHDQYFCEKIGEDTVIAL